MAYMCGEYEILAFLPAWLITFSIQKHIPQFGFTAKTPRINIVTEKATYTPEKEIFQKELKMLQHQHFNFVNLNKFLQCFLRHKEKKNRTWKCGFTASVKRKWYRMKFHETKWTNMENVYVLSWESWQASNFAFSADIFYREIFSAARKFFELKSCLFIPQEVWYYWSSLEKIMEETESRVALAHGSLCSSINVLNSSKNFSFLSVKTRI